MVGIASFGLSTPHPPVFSTDTVFALVLRATSDLQVVPIMDNGAQGQTELRGRKRQATNATGNQPSQQLGGLA